MPRIALFAPEIILEMREDVSKNEQKTDILKVYLIYFLYYYIQSINELKLIRIHCKLLSYNNPTITEISFKEKLI